MENQPQEFPSLEEALKQNKISSKTYEKVKIAKAYIEKKYKMKKIQEEEKQKDWNLIMKKLKELQISDQDSESIKKAIQHREAEHLRLKRKKMNIREFESLAIIGKGAFGEVRICRYIQTGEIFAIKKMKKEEMQNKNQVLHIRAEKDVLAEAHNQWIVGLKFSFQDDDFLYLVMEYLPGGDLMSLLIKREILTEDEARFYAAELVLAVESVHNLNCIHRDLKPDNVLIDKNGHIKLSDFGLSKKTELPVYEIENANENLKNEELARLLSKSGTNMSKGRKRRILAFTTVGTPDYIAPEVFKMKGYGPEVDWWSLGVILFEMLIGYAPFSSDTPTDTCRKILNHKHCLKFPDDVIVSKEAEDLIKKLVTDVDVRLGYNGSNEIKNHPFFRNVDFESIAQKRAPFIPELNGEADTQYFDSFVEDEPFYPEIKEPGPKKASKNMNFVDFTYKRGMDEQKTSIVSALEVLESIKSSFSKVEEDKPHLRHISNLCDKDETAASNIYSDNKSDKNLEDKIEIKDEIEPVVPLKHMESEDKEETQYLNNKNKEMLVISPLNAEKQNFSSNKLITPSNIQKNHLINTKINPITQQQLNYNSNSSHNYHITSPKNKTPPPLIKSNTNFKIKDSDKDSKKVLNTITKQNSINPNHIENKIKQKFSVPDQSNSNNANDLIKKTSRVEEFNNLGEDANKNEQGKKNNTETIHKQQFISKNFLKDVVSSESNLKLESSSKMSGNKIKLNFVSGNSQTGNNIINNNQNFGSKIGMNKQSSMSSKNKIEKTGEKEKVYKKPENPLKNGENKNKK